MLNQGGRLLPLALEPDNNNSEPVSQPAKMTRGGPKKCLMQRCNDDEREGETSSSSRNLMKRSILSYLHGGGRGYYLADSASFDYL